MHLLLLAALLLLTPACLRAQSAEGIGINMNTPPLGVFHVNGADANRTDDDVVIDPEGRTAIGTVTPTARLTIDTRSTPGVYPLRLRDGSHGRTADILVSTDDEGHAAWQTVTPPQPDIVYETTTLATSPVAYPLNTPTKVTTSERQITEDGFYSVDVRWWAEFDNSDKTTLQQSVTRFQLRRNDTEVIDEIKYHETTRYRWTAFFTLYATARTGDRLSLYVMPEDAPSGATHLYIAPTGANSMAWCLSKVRYKKLGIGNASLFN